MFTFALFEYVGFDATIQFCIQTEKQELDGIDNQFIFALQKRVENIYSVSEFDPFHLFSVSLWFFPVPRNMFSWDLAFHQE